MDFFSFINLFCGLGLFLYGVSVMGGSLERAALSGMGRGLRRLTGTPVRGLFLGTAVTAVAQSSSAAAVMTAELVGAGVLPLRQAVGVIMGANIGTTATAHLLCIGGRGLFRALSPDVLSSLAVAVGAGLYLAAKKNRPRVFSLGQLVLGFGLLMTGMARMEAAVAPLRELPAFLRLFHTAAEDPLVGVLAGAAVTAVIQSSSASVGMLQAAAVGGAVSFSAAAPILLGQNIGTCATPILASVGAKRGARQTAAVHLLLNLLGSVLALAALYGTGLAEKLPFWERAVSKRDIAWCHTLFNLAVAAVFLPLSGWLERLVRRLVPDD